ncbi:unnamed protein product, partial [Timema podura]|nr:unnamed protein product [Timema podura]
VVGPGDSRKGTPRYITDVLPSLPPEGGRGLEGDRASNRSLGMPLNPRVCLALEDRSLVKREEHPYQAPFGMSTTRTNLSDYTGQAGSVEVKMYHSLDVEALYRGSQVPITCKAFVFEKKELEGKYRCSGAIVTSRWILSAAHCYGDQPKDVNGRTYYVVIGAISLQEDPDSPRVKNIPVEKIYIHPLYHRIHRPTKNIALIKLSTLLSRSESETYIKILGNKYSWDKKTCELIGWRREKDEKSLVPGLRKIKVDTLPYKKCGSSKDILKSRSYICSKSPSMAKGPCDGKHSGLLVCDHLLVGFLTRENKCENEKFREYVDIGYLETWVRLRVQNIPSERRGESAATTTFPHISMIAFIVLLCDLTFFLKTTIDVLLHGLLNILKVADSSKQFRLR